MSHLHPLITTALALLSLTGCGLIGGRVPTDDSAPDTDDTSADDTSDTDTGEVVHGYRWKAVSAGAYTACGITTDGEIVCWGHRGAIGAQTMRDVPAGSDFTALSVGGSSACALDNMGFPVCWGVLSGEEPPPHEPLISISVVTTFACGVRALDGSIVCWGEQRVLGGDPTRPDLLPQGEFVQVTMSYATGCALRTTGELVCWNHEFYAYDDSGDHDLQAPLVPTRSGLVQFDIDGGSYPFGCAVDDAGEVVCWAWWETHYQPTSPARAVSVGLRWWCSLDVEGDVACHGTEPWQAPDGVGFFQIDLGDRFGCGVTTDADMRCWGDGAFGATTPPK